MEREKKKKKKRRRNKVKQIQKKGLVTAMDSVAADRKEHPFQKVIRAAESFRKVPSPDVILCG